jgi:hypothetical protein
MATPDDTTPTTTSTDVTQQPDKPVDEWVTGDEPMTGPQKSYLHTLAQEAGEDVPDDLTKAAASEMIDQLQQSTGRGAS